MEAIIIGSHVEVDDIAFYQGSCVRNAVANDLIDRGAAAAWEVVIVPGRRIGACCNDKVVHDFIDRLSGHTWCYCSVACI